MKVLTLHQPHASLCVIINPETGLPYKGLETRRWAPPKSLIGQRIALHAAVRPPCGKGWRKETWVGNWRVHHRLGDGGYDLSLYVSQGPVEGIPWKGLLDRHELPLGAIVATCVLQDVVPIVGMGGEFPTDFAYVKDMMDPIASAPLTLGRPWVQVVSHDNHGQRCVRYYDEVAYGDFSTDGKQRYAWLLADVVPIDPPVKSKGGQRLTKTWEPA